MLAPLRGVGTGLACTEAELGVGYKVLGWVLEREREREQEGHTVHSCICWRGPNADEKTRPPTGLP